MYGRRIDGARVTLAPPPPGAVDDYLTWFGDPEVTRYLRLRNPPSDRVLHTERRYTG